MVDKYYTPEIEEFHVGFEYEVEDLGDDGKTRVWRPQIFEGEETRTYFIEELKKGEIRVKYLDREDIESLGFKQDHNHNDVRFGYTNGSTRIQHTPHKNSILIYQWGRESDTVSGITIKNKSELKRLLKQLNI